MHNEEWGMCVIIIIGLLLVMGIVIGAMGKNKKIWITSLILLVIYMLVINPWKTENILAINIYLSKIFN